MLGITDTAMLRPQVFAFCEGEVQVGLICSEKQAIDATLLSLSREDKRICPVADRYWNARGGSHTDGGAFIFNLAKDQSGKMQMTCTDKFGKPVPMPRSTEPCNFAANVATNQTSSDIRKIEDMIRGLQPVALFEYFRDNISSWSFDEIRSVCRLIGEQGREPKNTAMAIEALTLLNDRRYPTDSKKRSHIIHIVRSELYRLLRALPHLEIERRGDSTYRLINYENRCALRAPRDNEVTLVIDSRRFPPEGDQCDASILRGAYLKGWRRFIVFDCHGQRFIGCGLGPETDDVTIDVYGSSGDYLGSGLDGLTITVHGNAQDQLGQIIKSGKLIVHGDVGQTFMYGAKGGSVYILGNAAGRPLINSVGRPRVVINGTCLDFLAESFMAGDALNGGGFVVLNGIEFDDDGRIISKPEPYPGSNLFSLASGGAIYIRDPHNSVIEQQLNSGRFVELTDKDWDLILPYLEENQHLFGITVEELLTIDGEQRTPAEIYRKVVPGDIDALVCETTDDVFMEDESTEEVFVE
jgi:glutamate synthase domain-containing protein 3